MTDIHVVTVDGPSGSGKGVITKHIANYYGYHILDSGALYRLVGLAARKAGIDLDTDNLDEESIASVAATMNVDFKATEDPENPLQISLDGEDVTAAVRTDEAGVDASAVAPLGQVRDSLFDLQRSFRRAPGLVADGRDMGTVVFPDADVKIYLTASAEARAERRYNQLKDKDISVSLHDLFLSIQARDERDTTREVSPLRPADDAHVIDSTDMTIPEVFDQVINIVTEKLG